MSEERLSPLGKHPQCGAERMKDSELTFFSKVILAEFEAQVADDARLQERFTRQLAGNDPTKLERLRNGDYKEAVAYCESVGDSE